MLIQMKVKRKIKEEPDVQSLPDQCLSVKRFKLSPLNSQLSLDNDVETSTRECEGAQWITFKCVLRIILLCVRVALYMDFHVPKLLS